MVQVDGTPDGEALAAQAANPNGATVAHARVIPINALGEAVTEADGTRWWEVEVGVAGGDSAFGWVREKDHAQVRLCTPWDWPGFEIVEIDSTPPRELYAHHVVQQAHATPDEQAELEAEGSGVDGGTLFRKLYDVIDLDGDKALTPMELRQALTRPWLAQALSHLIIRHESEWSGPMSKWHAMDDLIPESRKEDWNKEKERIESLLWWSEVKGNHGLPGDESLVAYNLHPVGLVENFFVLPNSVCKTCGSPINLTEDFIREISGRGVSSDFVSALSEASGDLFRKYDIDSCSQIKHLLAQAKKETNGFISFRESLNYSRRTYTAESLYSLAPTAINNGFSRKGITFRSHAEKIKWIDENLIGNDAAYGEHCFGSNEQPGKDFRGRGFIHLTHYETYRRCAQATGLPIDSNPELLENDPDAAIESALWFWKDRDIGPIADNLSNSGDSGVTAVTRPINTGLAGLSDRQKYKREISPVFNRHFNSGCTKND